MSSISFSYVLRNNKTHFCLGLCYWIDTCTEISHYQLHFYMIWWKIGSILFTTSLFSLTTKLLKISYLMSSALFSFTSLNIISLVILHIDLWLPELFLIFHYKIFFWLCNMLFGIVFLILSTLQRSKCRQDIYVSVLQFFMLFKKFFNFLIFPMIGNSLILS